MLILGWMLSKQDKLGKLVTLLQEEISRLNGKVITLEQKLESKDREIERKSIIIAECYACRVQSAKCPALKMQAFYNRQNFPYDETNNKTNTENNAVDDVITPIDGVCNNTPTNINEHDQPP